MRKRAILNSMLVLSVVLTLVSFSAAAMSASGPTTTIPPDLQGMSESERDQRLEEVYRPDPASPPTTVPELPTHRRILEPVERTMVVHELPLVSTPDESLLSRRVVIDRETGGVIAVGDPGQPIKPVTEQQLAQSTTYQTDRIYLNDNTSQNVYNVDLWVYIANPQCSDSDSCSGGTRKLSGYVWYTASHVFIGSTPSECLYSMHAGIAMGNGISNDWYFSWGGYNCGGSALGSGKGNAISLDSGKWYRIRIWRLAPSGNDWPWGAWVMDWNSGQEWYAGSWTLASGQMISGSVYFTELAEPSVCVTDYYGTHNRWVEYRDPWGKHLYTTGTANYDNSCTNTNLRGVPPASNRYTIDDREVPRTNPNGTVLFNIS